MANTIICSYLENTDTGQRGHGQHATLTLTVTLTVTLTIISHRIVTLENR